MPKPSPRERAVAFFHEHAGYSYPSGASPAEQVAARRAHAESLADAESRASALGWDCVWEPDPDTDSSDWIPPTRDGGKGRKPWGTWYARLVNESGETLASLGGIDFGRDGEPWGHPYRRVVEAELSSENLPEDSADYLGCRLDGTF